jgi:hypothetical protein
LKQTKKFKSAAHAKQARELADEWNKLLSKHASTPFGTNGSKAKVATKPPALDVPRRLNAKSLVTPGGQCTKVEPMVYTGDKMLGVAQMHKSNAVPVFKQEDAIAISAMRR